MTKVELLTINYVQKIATGNMTLDVISKLELDKDVKDLWFAVHQLIELNELLEYELSKVDFDEKLAVYVVYTITDILGKYNELGTSTITESVLAQGVNESTVLVYN